MLPKSLLDISCGIIICICLAACSSPQPVTDTAKLLATYTNKVKEDGEAFAQFRQQLARGRLEDLAALSDSTLNRQQDLTQGLAIWSISQEQHAVKLYQQVLELMTQIVSDKKEAEKIRREQDESIKQTAKSVSIRSEKLMETAKLLGQLAEDRALTEDVKFMGEFIGEVCKSLADSHKGTTTQVKCPTK